MLGKNNEYLSDFVYGGIDGAITTLAIMAGAVGASLSPIVIVILGFANLSADGFSMGASNYLSTRSQNDLAEKHGHVHPNLKNPLTSATATFIAFIVIGFIPLFPYLVAPFFPSLNAYTHIFSFAFGAVAFLLVGSIQGYITNKNKWYTALRTLVIGGVAAFIAYSIGYALNQWLG